MKTTMKALVCHAGGNICLEERPLPVLQAETDAIVEVTCSTICMSDLHIMHGAVPRALPDIVLGHEFVGKVVELGAAVKGLRIGDHVSANCITFCGDCWFCRQGFINNCVHGGWELGCRIDGCQAEYVRVPFASQGLTKIPAGVTDRQALFVGDILASGYFGAELCEIRPGDTVAVIGAGPVGLCAMPVSYTHLDVYKRQEQYPLAVQQVPDLITGSALAGLYSGLSHAHSLYSFVVACDMPFINVNYIAYLKKQLFQQSYLAAATLYEDWGEPLHGFYHQALLIPMAEFLLSGQKSMFRFLQSQQEQVLFVPEAVARGFSPDWRMFFNINTPKDLEEYHILKQWTENLAT